jgi:hypothetical protein
MIMMPLSAALLAFTVSILLVTRSSVGAYTRGWTTMPPPLMQA